MIRILEKVEKLFVKVLELVLFVCFVLPYHSGVNANKIPFSDEVENFNWITGIDFLHWFIWNSEFVIGFDVFVNSCLSCNIRSERGEISCEFNQICVSIYRMESHGGFWCHFHLIFRFNGNTLGKTFKREFQYVVSNTSLNSPEQIKFAIKLALLS